MPDLGPYQSLVSGSLLLFFLDRCTQALTACPCSGAQYLDVAEIQRLFTRLQGRGIEDLSAQRAVIMISVGYRWSSLRGRTNG